MRARITREPIEPAALLADLATSADGATVLFLGHVRDRNEGREVTGIQYDAYVEMAERTLEEIAGDAAARLGTSHLALVHRIGELAVGEVSVAIAVASPTAWRPSTRAGSPSRSSSVACRSGRKSATRTDPPSGCPAPLPRRTRGE